MNSSKALFFILVLISLCSFSYAKDVYVIPVSDPLYQSCDERVEVIISKTNESLGTYVKSNYDSYSFIAIRTAKDLTSLIISTKVKGTEIEKLMIKPKYKFSSFDNFSRVRSQLTRVLGSMAETTLAELVATIADRDSLFKTACSNSLQALSQQPIVKSPAPGSMITSNLVKFTFDPKDNPVTRYLLYLGISVGYWNLNNQPVDANPGTLSVDGVPTDGSNIYGTFLYKMNGYWSSGISMQWSTSVSAEGFHWQLTDTDLCPICPESEKDTLIGCFDRYGTPVDDSLCTSKVPFSSAGSWSFYVHTYGNCGGAGVDVKIERRIGESSDRYEYRAIYQLKSDYYTQPLQTSEWSSDQLFFNLQHGRDNPWFSLITGLGWDSPTFVLGSCKGNDNPYSGYEVFHLEDADFQ